MSNGMIGYLLIGAVIVLLVMVGSNRSVFRLPAWRIGAAMGSLFAFAGAGYALMRRQWAVAIVLLVVGLWTAVSARFPRQGQRGGSSRTIDRNAMSEAEARSILGVDETATREEIKAAYSRLMKRVHPDHGGAAGLATQLNAARDRLLKR